MIQILHSIDGDGIVNLTDLLAVIAAWGTTELADLLAVIGNWNP